MCRSSRSADVVSCVAAFAPVRHTWFHGTTFPKITRPRFERPAVRDLHICGADCRSNSISGGNCADGPFAASCAPHAFTTASKSRSGASPRHRLDRGGCSRRAIESDRSRRQSLSLSIPARMLPANTTVSRALRDESERLIRRMPDTDEIHDHVSRPAGGLKIIVCS